MAGACEPPACISRIPCGAREIPGNIYLRAGRGYGTRYGIAERIDGGFPLAARRGAKNQRRKAVVAQKRKAELDAGTIAGRVRLALAYPIQHCLLTRGLFEVGMGTLIVARGATPYSLTMAGFLLDTFALGVKDSFLISINGQELADYLDSISDLAPAEPVDPGYARKLLHDLVSWARTVGFAPHRDYLKLEPIYGSVAAASDPRFKFGHEGKPMLIGDLSDADEMWDALDITVTADELTELSE
jgi:hypothetical protein